MLGCLAFGPSGGTADKTRWAHYILHAEPRGYICIMWNILDELKAQVCAESWDGMKIEKNIAFSTLR